MKARFAGFLAAVRGAWLLLPLTVRKAVRDTVVLIIGLFSAYTWVAPGSWQDARAQAIGFALVAFPAAWAIVRVNLLPAVTIWLLGWMRSQGVSLKRNPSAGDLVVTLTVDTSQFEAAIEQLQAKLAQLQLAVPVGPPAPPSS